MFPLFADAAGLTLEQAFRSALEKNETVRQSGEQVTQANERVRRLRGGLLPELSFGAYHLLQPTPDDPIAREFSPANQTTANLTLTQPIFRGFREFAGIRQQKQSLLAQEAVKKQAIQRLYQEVAVNYLNVLTLEQDLKNLAEQIDIYERRVGELRARARRGESSTTELLSSQSTLNSLKAELRLVQGQVKVARETFHSLTGKPREESLEDPSLIPKGRKFAATDLREYLSRIESRPDIQANLAQQSAAEEGIAIARGAHYPVLDATGNYYLTRPGFLSDIKWDVSVRLAFPLFSGGAIQAQVREAASRNKEAELELARVRRLAEEEIRSLHESLEARLEHLAFLRESVELAGKNVSVSQSEFRRGLTRSIDVQLALGEYRVIRRQLDQAHFSAQMDLLRLEVASGLKPQGLNEGMTP